MTEPSMHQSIIGMDNPKQEFNITINKILSKYPKGIIDIISTPKPPSNDPILILVLRGPDNFIKKYINIARREETFKSNEELKECPEPPKSHSTDFKETNTVKYNNFVQLYQTNKQKVIDQIKLEVKETKKYIRIIQNVFNELRKSNQVSIDRLIRKYLEQKKNKWEKCNKEYVEIIEEILQEQYGDKNTKYKLSFSDFVLLFCRIIHYMTEIDIKLEMRSKNSHKVMLNMFCKSNKQYKKLAKFFGYELQLKPYAWKYYNVQKEARIKKKDNNSNTINTIQLNKGESLQFQQLNEDNCLHFPPYMPFEPSKEAKFRLYEKNDDYAQCTYEEDTYDKYPEPNIINNESNSVSYDPSFNRTEDNEQSPSKLHTLNNEKVSLFRNIDKLRLIHMSLMQILQFSSLYKENMISMILYQRNSKAYADKIKTSNIVLDIMHFYSKERFMRTITTIRNYFGEHFSYYFLWAFMFTYWMIIPTLIGIIMKFTIDRMSSHLSSKTVNLLGAFEFKLYNVCLLGFCLLIDIWATFFLKKWKQQENMYRYFWGMEKFSVQETTSEFFTPEALKPFILGEQIRVVSLKTRIIKTIASYSLILLTILIRFIFHYYTCWIFTSTYKEINLHNLILLSIVSGVSTKLFGYLNESIAFKLSIWENNETTVKQQHSFAIKLVILEVVNNYLYLLYIAFYKPTRMKTICYGGDNCLYELEIGIYVMLFCNFIFSLIEFVYPFIKKNFRRKFGKLNKKDLKLDIVIPHSVEHEMLCDGKNNLVKEYNKKMIRFGFICFFSAAAPVSPLIVFLISLFENFTDTYKIFNLYRIEIIEGSSGIGIYNSIFKTLYNCGMMININIVFITGSLFKFKLENEEDVENLKTDSGFLKIILFLALLENIMMLVVRTFNPKQPPLWFQHLDDVKELYEKKYYFKEGKELPHLQIQKK